MWKDGFFVTHRVLPGWTFDQAAACLVGQQSEFLRIPSGATHPVGRWSLSCIPLKDYVNEVLNDAHIAHLREYTQNLFQVYESKGLYYTRKKVADLMKKDLEYPPYPLDKAALEMRSWASKMFWEGRCFNLPIS